MSKRQTLAFEIGTEEIPAFDLNRATEQLEGLVNKALESVRLAHGNVSVYSTPRRIIALVDEVAEETEALEEEFRGPSAKIAFDAEGNPTKAALGFARGKGVSVDELEIRNVKGIDYVFAVRSVASQRAIDLLPDVLYGVIVGLSWPKSCHWGTTHELFSRPVRWLLALLGESIIPVRFADLEASNITWGHRFLAPGPHEVPSAGKLLDTLQQNFVVPSAKEREQIIRLGVAKAEQDLGCHAELPAKTLTEVINLAEYPTVLVGTFSPDFLKVPDEIIVDAMLMHQRYFPLYDNLGALTNRFIVVSNGNPECADIIIDGNERVVAARLYDAKFFYEEDLKHPLEYYVDALDDVVFQETLGTMRKKTARVEKLAAFIADEVGCGLEERGDVIRAAHLAKADLVTNAVIEFTSVQGVMGSYYARLSGESDAVARAIGDHYKPRFSGDDIPEDVCGQVVAIADKLDTICGLFAVDQAPTSSSDPFGLRRAALGIVAILEEGLPLQIVDAIKTSLAIYADEGLVFEGDAVFDQIVAFFITRTRVLLLDEGKSGDAIDAVLSINIQEPVELIRRVRALELARNAKPAVFEDLATAYARANNLRVADEGISIDEELLGPTEQNLLVAMEAANKSVLTALDRGDFSAALEDLAALRKPIDQFFEDVMVMDDDPALRSNRLRLLNRFVNVFGGVADFSLLSR